MSDIPTATLAEAVDTQITQDTPCVRCGYNLRGLTARMVCPECATPVAAATHGNLLACADPEWLDKLRLGTLIRLWIIVLVIIAIVVAIVLRELVVGRQELISLAIQLPIAGLGVWASFLITSQEPRIALAEDTVTLRKVVRGCAVAGLATTLLSDTRAYRDFGGDTLLWALKVTGGLVAIVAWFGEFIYYRRFARRIPDESLARRTTIVMWGLTACFGLFGISAALAVWASVSGQRAAVGTLGVPCACVGSLALLIFGVWYIVLLVRYKRAFTLAAQAARDITEPSPPPCEPPAGARFP